MDFEKKKNFLLIFPWKGEESARRGQAMLIAVLALGGAILGATTIAGFLMTYQIKQTTDFRDSASAVFAADAGTQWALYDFFIDSSTAMSAFNNGATTTVACYDTNGNTIACGDSTAGKAISKGYSGESARAFEVTFAQ